ncbi:MAG: hypothetical protein ACI8X5_003311 [Planctomycetota bacterium]|jgi:hypothetical protein
MIEFLPQNDGNLVAINFHGKITHEEFGALEPMIEAQIEKDGGEIRLLLDLMDFDGYEDLHALWEHFVIVKNHHQAVKRIAILGHADWERRVAELASRFSIADVGFYADGDVAAALDWLVQG